MVDGFTEASSTGYLERIGGAIKGVVVGLLLFVVTFPVLFMNEGCAVKRYRALTAGRGAVVEVASAAVDPANDGELVYMNGEATTDETLSDEQFGVSVVGIALDREAEMYQWKENVKKETKKKLGGGEETITTYDYEEVWSLQLIQSSGFHEKGRDAHQNPTTMAVEGSKTLAKDVRLGAFTLTSTLIGKVGGFDDVPLTNEMAEQAAKSLGRAAVNEAAWIYLGDDPKVPKNGDIRVRFRSVSSPQTVSVIAEQREKSFSNWSSGEGDTLEQSLSMGIKTPDEIFSQKESAEAVRTWIVRAVGCLLMFFGVAMVLNPLSVLADVVPFIGDVVGAGTLIVAFLVAAPLSLLTMAVAWLFYRPLIGIPLVLLAVGFVVGLILLLRKSRASKQQAAPA